MGVLWKASTIATTKDTGSKIRGNGAKCLMGAERVLCCGRNDDGMLISDEFFYGFKRKAHVGAEFLDG